MLRKERERFCSLLLVPGHGKPSFVQFLVSEGSSVTLQLLGVRTALVLGSMHCLLLLDNSLVQNVTHGVHDDHSLSFRPISVKIV